MRWMLLLVLVGCGSESAADKLQGKWLGAENGACTNALSFVDDQYEEDFICGLSGSTFGLAATVGRFTMTGDYVVFTAQQATCPGTARRTWSVTESVNGETLTLTTLGTVDIFTRIHEMPSAAVGVSASFGCFADGRFTASPLQTVQ